MATPHLQHSPPDAESIVFVLGAARSGTSWINDILDECFDFGTAPEGHFVTEFAKRLDRYGDLSRGENMRRLMTDIRQASTLRILREEWPKSLRFDVSVDELCERVRTPDYPGAVFAVFRCIADKRGKRHVCTKDPYFTMRLPMLEGLFGERARYINVVRDGRDVALSTMRQSWGQKSVYSCAKHWRRCIDLADQFAQRVASSRFLSVRYEDLLHEPGPILATLEAFLGEPVARESRDRFLEEIEARGRNSDKWRTEMSARDVARFEAVAAPQLRKWGYETTCTNPSVGFVERSLFDAAEFARKLRLTLPDLLR